MSLPEGRDAGFASGRVSGVEGRNILGVRLPEDEARARFAAGPVVRLGTADGEGRPHVVVVTFAVDGDMVYTAVDQKPKSGRPLKRLRNVGENPVVTMLADHYSEDWETLWWVRADGRAAILTGRREMAAPLRLLTDRCWRYRWSGGPAGAAPGQAEPRSIEHCGARAASALDLRGAAGAGGGAARRRARGLPAGTDLPGQRSVPAVRAQLHRRAVEPGRAAAERVLGADHPDRGAAPTVAGPADAASGRPGHRRAGIRGADQVRRADLAGGAGHDPGAVRPAAARARAVRADRRVDAAADHGGAGPAGVAAGRADGPRHGDGRAAARGGGDVPGPGTDHDRPGRAVRATAAGTAADPAGRADRVLPGAGGGLPGVVRRGARAMELHHVRRGVPVRAGGGLRRLPGPEPSRLRAAAVPGGAAVAADRGLLHLEPGITPVDLHAPGRHVQGRGRARLQPADPAAPAGRLRRSRRPGLRLRVLAGPRGRAGTVLTGLPAVPDDGPAGPAGVRLDREARLLSSGDTRRAGRVPGRVRAVVLPAGAAVRGRARARPGRAGLRPGRPESPAAVHGQRGGRPAAPGHVRHLRLAVPAAAAQPHPGGRRPRR